MTALIDTKVVQAAFQSVREALAAADQAEKRKRRSEVRACEDFQRIRALPARDPKAYVPHLTDQLTAIFARNPQARLFDSQAIALYEIAAFGGFIGNITMGGGKTLISLLACTGKRGLILLPANLIPKTRAEMARYALDWKVPGNITLMSYEKLSRVGQDVFLDELKPEIIVCDEAQAIKNHSTGIHRRLRRYVQKTKCAFVAFSGTMIGENLSTWAHAASWALHERSPAPLKWAAQAEWSNALSREPKIAPGALQEFASLSPVGDFKEGYQLRVEYSPGIYITKGVGADNALEFERFEVPLSPVLEAAVKKLIQDWELPTGETIHDPLAFHRAARQLELGCYYRWVEQPPEKWKETRLAWSQTVRAVIRYSRSLDTEQAVINALDRGYMPDAKTVLDAWRAIKNTFTPTTQCVWVDRDPVRQIAERARKGQPCIVWLHHAEVGEEFERCGIPYYGAGGKNKVGHYIESATGKHSIAASIASNHKGRNLQKAFGRNIIAELMREPLILEQLVARTHRHGQERDTVSVEVNTSTAISKRAWQRIQERSTHVQVSSGQPQRLLLGTHINPLSDIEILELAKAETEGD